MLSSLDCPFPIAWTADALTEAVPRPLSAAFDTGLPFATRTGRRAAAFNRSRVAAPDRDLPTLFRVR